MTTPTVSSEELELISVKQIQALLGVSRNTAYDRTRDLDFPTPFRFGNALRWDRGEVMKWVHNRRATRSALTHSPAGKKPATIQRKKAVRLDVDDLPAPRPVARRLDGDAA